MTKKIGIWLGALSMLVLPIHSQDTLMQSTWKFIYNERQVPSYHLPDPLLSEQGFKIMNKEQWEEVRRAELLHLFRTYIYGYAPTIGGAFRFETDTIDMHYLGGMFTRKCVSIYVDGHKNSPVIHTILCIPNNKKGSVGKHAVFLQVAYTLKLDTTVLKRLASHGFGFALYAISEVAPDDSARAYKEGIIPYYYKTGQTFPHPEQWGTISAWAWAASRVMDYLQNDQDVDPKKVAIIGQSRLGKTALWAGAQDTRFSLIVPVNSGCVGAALSKRCFGETIWSINKIFPHWFSGNFKQFNQREQFLPVDQHELIALCAPRPVYICTAEDDIWADPYGQYLAGWAAGSVYALYGKEGFATEKMPVVNTPIQSGSVGFHIRSGEHALLAYDWEQAIRFAEKYFR